MARFTERLYKYPLISFGILFWIAQLIFIFYGGVSQWVICYVDFLLFLFFILYFYVSSFDKTADRFKEKFEPPIKTFFIFLGFYYFTSATKFIGGDLWGDICILCGSLMLLWEIILIIYHKVRYGSLDDTYLVQRQKHIFRRNILKGPQYSVLLLVIVLSTPGFLTVGSFVTEDISRALSSEVNSLMVGCDNDTQKVNAIISWFNKTQSGNDNIANIYYRVKEDKVLLYFTNTFYIFKGQPQFGFRLIDDPLWVYNSRCGRCGEYASLFAEMAHRAGLLVRKISCSGEDHAWAEVFIHEENTWKIIDPTAIQLPISTGYQQPNFMEKKVAGDRHRRVGYVSNVLATYPDGRTEDVTNRYTNLTNITVRVSDDYGNPLPAMTVEVKSTNRLQERDTGLQNSTNETGECTITIGGGNYTFEVHRKNDVFSAVTSYSGSFSENEPHQVNITFSMNVQSILNNPTNPSIILIVLGSIYLVMFLRKRKKKQKTTMEKDGKKRRDFK